MKHQAGSWRVMRSCCQSGNCVKCHGATTGKGSIRIEQASGYSEAYAKWVAGNWASYGAYAEPMPG
jgi:cytochrome c553